MAAMLTVRVIPCLLLKNGGLVKTVKFRSPTYIGDPINAVKIFNDKSVDELIFLDISATTQKRDPDLTCIREIASECFMPLGYGGGIKDIDTIRKILALGCEKVIINSYATEHPEFIQKASALFGNQSTVVALDVKKSLLGRYEVHVSNGTKNLHLDAVKYAKKMEEMGAGELFLNSIDRDGTMKGYDLELIQAITSVVNIPVVVCGGAGKIEDLREAVLQGGASAVAAGSLFVFHGRHKAVLINYPSEKEIADVFTKAIQ